MIYFFPCLQPWLRSRSTIHSGVFERDKYRLILVVIFVHRKGTIAGLRRMHWSKNIHSYVKGHSLKYYSVCAYVYMMRCTICLIRHIYTHLTTSDTKRSKCTTHSAGVSAFHSLPFAKSYTHTFSIIRRCHWQTRLTEVEGRADRAKFKKEKLCRSS